jgi:energy-coupling factor transporter ATP-binding protein EcfA2
VSTAALAFSTSPYPGLRPFHRHEADIFFGREAQTDQLLRKLQSTRFLAVVGPSGCGKSSLVRAGMIAGLEAGYMAEAGSRWRIAEMRPGNRPLRSLAETLVASADLLPDWGGAAAPVPLVEAGLRSGPRGLVELLDGSPLDDGSNLLLLVDQFEEIFRFRREGDPDEAEAFVSLLLETAREQDLPVYVVITMRSDFLGDCAVFPGLPEVLNESMYLTPRMTREQCRQAIEGPAGVFGGRVQESLVSLMLNELDPEPDQLPVLQHALMRLWTRAGGAPPGALLTPGMDDAAAEIELAADEYDAIGRLQNALSRHADEAYGELDAHGQEIARRLFTLLTDRGPGRRDVRRPVQVREVMDLTRASLEQVSAVVEVFRRPDRSFLTPPAGTLLLPDSVVDISHESLIRQWGQLGEWVEREASSASTYRRLMDTAQAWSRREEVLARDIALENAVKWRTNEVPTEAWASRYGSAEDFALVLRYITRSESRQKKMRWVGIVALLVPVALVVAILWALDNRRERDAYADLLAETRALNLRQTILQDSLRLAAAQALSELQRYGAALQSSGYYDRAADSAAASAYYYDADPRTPGLFGRLSERLGTTHVRQLPFAPGTYLFPWTDLHDDRTLRGIYSGQPPSADRPLLNVEQVVPESWFDLRLPMRGDLHNQFAIDAECNRYRGEAALVDFPDFPADSGPVRGELAGCGLRRGTDGRDPQFEPLAGKGPVARATLYFLLRYPREISAAELPPARLQVLLRWHREDPVSTYERHRNASIHVLQGNRNPFVDHPEWADLEEFAAAVGPPPR